MADTVAVTAIHRGQRFAVLDTGETIAFATLIGSDGKDTDDMEDAIAAEASLPDGRWILIDFDDFDERPLN